MYLSRARDLSLSDFTYTRSPTCRGVEGFTELWPPLAFFALWMVGLANGGFRYNVLHVRHGYLLVGKLVALCPKLTGGEALAAESGV